MITIYSLSDPRTNEIRYIGKTNKLNKRYSNHLTPRSSTHTANWITGLKSLGLQPIIEVVDVVPIEQWEFWERYWISQFKVWGFNLTNHQEGGGGYQIGKTRPDSPWNKGKNLSESIRLKMSESHKKLDHSWKVGRKQGQETINKRISKITGFNHPHSKVTQEQVLDIRNSLETNTTLATKYGIALRTVYRIKAKEVYNF